MTKKLVTHQDIKIFAEATSLFTIHSVYLREFYFLWLNVEMKMLLKEFRQPMVVLAYFWKWQVSIEILLKI